MFYESKGLISHEELEVYKIQFGSKAGELAGNHFLTITECKEKLMDIGREILYNGAETVEISIL